jgi:hypothetical protein
MEKTTERYQKTAVSICNLVVRQELDATDLKIIQARDCSPFPSMRNVASAVGIDVANVSRRTQRIERLVRDENKNIHPDR